MTDVSLRTHGKTWGTMKQAPRKAVSKDVGKPQTPAADAPAGKLRTMTEAFTPLADGPDRLALFTIEQALVSATQSFYRFNAAALSAQATNIKFSGEEVVIFMLLASSRTPRSVSEIARYANRDDVANIQYSLRKMIKAGVVQKTQSSTNRDTAYLVTEEGARLAEAFLRVRDSLLVDPAAHVPGLDDQFAGAVRAIALLSGLYDHGVRMLLGRG
jgi:predicted MarR family transcription regulator